MAGLGVLVGGLVAVAKSVAVAAGLGIFADALVGVLVAALGVGATPAATIATGVFSLDVVAVGGAANTNGADVAATSAGSKFRRATVAVTGTIVTPGALAGGRAPAIPIPSAKLTTAVAPIPPSTTSFFIKLPRYFVSFSISPTAFCI